jgi:hypothetical protein
MASKVLDPDAGSTFHLLTRAMYVPPGRYLITSPGALMDGARVGSGDFGYRLFGVPEATRIIYTPSTAGPLFNNLDRFLFPSVEGIHFVGGNSTAVCAYSASAGTAQGWTWRDCIWWGVWNEGFQLDASGGTANGNDSWAFERCRAKGTWTGAIFNSGISAGITGQDQAIAHTFTDCNMEPTGGAAAIIQLTYGGSVTVNGGSFIMPTGSGVIFSMPFGGTHFAGACSLQVNGTRFEIRSSTAKLVDCAWQFGNVQFNKISTDGFAVTAGQILASFYGTANAGPTVGFTGSTLSGRHEYSYDNNTWQGGTPSAGYSRCWIPGYADPQDFIVHTAKSGATNVGGMWQVDFDRCKTGATYGTAASQQATEVSTGWRRRMGGSTSVQTKSLKNAAGTLPIAATALVYKLPLRSVITAVWFYSPAAGSNATTTWSYTLTNGAGTTIATCNPGTAWNAGWNVLVSNLRIPLETDSARTLTLTASAGFSSAQAVNECQVTYLPGD